MVEADNADVDDWTEQIANLMVKFPRVYADVGAHSVIYEASHAKAYVKKLRDLAAHAPVLTERLMLGTDWHTIVRNPKHEEFIARYQVLFVTAFGTQALPGLVGANALAFLGLDKPGGKNRQRLEEFYKKNAIAKPKWWVG